MLSFELLSKIALLLLPSVLFHTCSSATEKTTPEAMDFRKHVTVYSTASTETLTRAVTARPDPNRKQASRIFKINDGLRELDTIIIAGTLKMVNPFYSQYPASATYAYRLPEEIHIGDNITFSGSLLENATMLEFLLVHRYDQSKQFHVDYNNVALWLTADISKGFAPDTFNMISVCNGTIKQIGNVKPSEKTFVRPGFKFQVGINPRSRSVDDFILDIYCNDKLLKSVELQGLNTVGYLQIAGQYSVVHDLKFNFA